MIKKEDIFAIFFYVGLIFIIIFPLLSPGYILSLDILAVDKFPSPSLTDINFLFMGLMYLLNQFLSAFILQKILLFTILFLSGLGMYRVAKTQNYLVKAISGLIYMVNPFIYERIISGQWSFVLGYAFFPWIISFTFNLYKSTNIFRIITLSALSAILASISSHFFVIFWIFFLIYFLVQLVFQSDNLVRSTLSFFKVILISVLFNINWLVGIFFTPRGVGGAFSTVGREEIVSFQSIADPLFGLVFNLLSGYGFWVEANRYFISPKSLMPLWPAATVFLVAISLYGFVLSIIKKKHLTFSIALGIFFIIALDLAIGVSVKHFSEIAFFLFDKLLILRIFRESQKFVGVLFFSYAYFGAFGLEDILYRLKGTKKVSFYAFSFILPAVVTLPMFWGFGGQLKTALYPESWYKVDSLLLSDRDEFLTLFLPWRYYMRFRFNNNQLVTNPAPHFFSKPILSSKNLETENPNLRDMTSENLHIEGLLSLENQGVNLLGEKVDEEVKWGESLSIIGIKYIILAHEEDWIYYDFLNNKSDFKKIYEDEDLTLYQNLKWGMPQGEPPIEPLEPLEPLE